MSRLKFAPVWMFAMGLIGGASLPAPLVAHDGPDPVAHWFFNEKALSGEKFSARLGPEAKVEGHPRAVSDPHGQSLAFDGRTDRIVVANDYHRVRKYLPNELLTVSAWLTVDSPQPLGAVVSVAQRNGEAQTGWLLGYDEQAFCFSLAAQGANDGNGNATTLRSQTEIVPGKFYQVVGTYDGNEMCLYVNGQLESRSLAQSGPLVYPRTAPMVIGGFEDADERTFHQGRIRELAIYDIVATPEGVAHEFEHGSELAAIDEPKPVDDVLRFVVTPYLQYATRDGITVMWETSRPSTSRVRYGETASFGATAGDEQPVTIHEVRLPDLKPQMGHFYQVESSDASGQSIAGPILSFQTANLEETPYMFGVIGDTQTSPRVAKVLTDLMWQQRPHFVVVAGDLVDAGPNKKQWTHEFFPGMNPLISRVPFFPVIGNHEQNAKHYYDYVSLPSPEYYYTFHYGNAQFFMLDSNKEVGPGSEQYAWLESQLASCQSTWKFVCYHHPCYSSDEDDYGNMWRGKSKHGDLRIRQLTPLYDKYGVDIVWNGHIHSYERTWPLTENKVVERGGTIYLVTGGGGGTLETAGPIKPWFQNSVKHGHHFCLCAVNGRTLEFKAFDYEGRLFDYLKIDKGVVAAPVENPAPVAGGGR